MNTFKVDIDLMSSLPNMEWGIYCYLELFAQSQITNMISFSHVKLRNNLGIKDNRTLKKCLTNLYLNNIILNEISDLPKHSTIEINFNSNSEYKNYIDCPMNLLYLSKFIGAQGFKLACYYICLDNNNLRSTLKTTKKVLGCNEATIVKYNEILKEYGVIEIMSQSGDKIKNGTYGLTDFNTLTPNVINTYKIMYEQIHNSNLIDKEIYDDIFEKSKVINAKFIKKSEFKTNSELESELEKSIIENIELIEDGMKFLDSQYQVKDGRIDILARDKNNVLCIIELKVESNGKDLIFQSVYYPTQFNEHTRMITICPDYDYKIKTSLESLGNVEMKLYRYNEDGNLVVKDYK